ncbi:MAG: Lrp/AsnC family transcriptional regulator [Desulfurococcales archaeon]|nr:Lrp/AsnC family transcriptional regulator [Desulfurococcales archaeon]
MTVDEKDLMIIKMLRRNARTSLSEIGKTIGISDVAVLKRLRKLEKEGVISGYTVTLDPKKLGYNSMSMTGVNVQPEHLFKVIEILRKRPEVTYLAVTTGDHTIMAIIQARDAEELARIHEEIERYPGVTSVRPAIIVEEIKNNALCLGIPMADEEETDH